MFFKRKSIFKLLSLTTFFTVFSSCSAMYSNSNVGFTMRCIGGYLDDKPKCGLFINENSEKFVCPVCENEYNFDTSPVQVIFGCGKGLYLTSARGQDISDEYSKLASSGHVLDFECAREWILSNGTAMVCPVCKNVEDAYFVYSSNEANNKIEGEMYELDFHVASLKKFEDEKQQTEEE